VGCLIDTSIFIEFEKQRLDIEPNLAARAGESFFMSVITVSELLHGVHRAVEPGLRSRRSALVEDLIGAFPILDIDLMTARSHAKIWSELKAAGNVIGLHDLWLAATCIVHELTMITANTRDFARIPDLKTESWS
jgi:tRNA(fMet)-specific endonuclease VapC